MILTHQVIDNGRSINGGWSRQQLALFGIKWPLPKGWKSKLAGTEFDTETIDLFLALKDRHIKHAMQDEFVFATEGL
jgi:hypothetical protein